MQENELNEENTTGDMEEVNINHDQVLLRNQSLDDNDSVRVGY